MKQEIDSVNKNKHAKDLIGQALDILEEHIHEIKTLGDWAMKMGWQATRSFSDTFRRHYGKRPQPVLLAYRTKKQFNYCEIPPNQTMLSHKSCS